jgi:hypothetical protein
MTMQDSQNSNPVPSRRAPLKKGKLTGAKPPLRPKHVWSICTKLQMADRKRDLALFNLANASKLRGCDVVALKVEDIASHPPLEPPTRNCQSKKHPPLRNDHRITAECRKSIQVILSQC